MGNNNERRRFWKLGKQAAFNCYPTMYKEIKKAQKQNQGLSLQKIQELLNCCKSFIGCYASDQLENISINHFPCTLIVNTDECGMKGSHWISLRISKRKVELFDSLGLIYENKLPLTILSFIQRFAISRSFKFNKRLQPDSSVLCGFYCIFFIFLRQFCSFRSIQLWFHDTFIMNDKLIIKFFR